MDWRLEPGCIQTGKRGVPQAICGYSVRYGDLCVGNGLVSNDGKRVEIRRRVVALDPHKLNVSVRREDREDDKLFLERGSGIEWLVTAQEEEGRKKIQQQRDVFRHRCGFTLHL